MNETIISKVVEQLQTMPESLQREVLSFTKRLSKTTGIPGASLLQYAGIISPVDLKIIKDAIDADCEQADLDEW